MAVMEKIFTGGLPQVSKSSLRQENLGRFSVRIVMQRWKSLDAIRLSLVRKATGETQPAKSQVRIGSHGQGQPKFWELI